MRGVHDRGLRENEGSTEPSFLYQSTLSVPRWAMTRSGWNRRRRPQLEEVQFRSGVEATNGSGVAGLKDQKSQRTKVSSGLVVLEPEDLAACNERNDDVQIAILIQIGDHRMIGLTTTDAIEIRTGFSRKTPGPEALFSL